MIDNLLDGIFDDLSDLLARLLADPIVLDLDGDGIELTSLATSSTLFDIDDDGVLERTGWVGPQDGLLVHDANHNGIADGIGELFGSANVDGYDELVTIDANGDGRIDALDPAFADLHVWRDVNADGISTADEMLTLTETGITRFNLSYTQPNSDLAGNVVARIGSYVRADGTTRAMASVQFALEEPAPPAIPEDADITDLLRLPNLPGGPGVPDLRTAMYFDPVLKQMVDELVRQAHDFDTFLDFQQGGFLDILYRWVGVDTSVPLQPGDDPYYVQALAGFMGRPFGGLSASQLARIDDVWPNLVKQLGVQFLVQAANNPAFEPFFDLAQSVSALDPDSPTFVDDLTALTEAAVSASASARPAYDYLELFEGLRFDASNGTLAGDFDALVRRFIDDQPPFFTSWGSAGSSMGGGARILMSPDGDYRHPWTAWYEDQGSLLYQVAQAMGIGGDHVLNVTGWRWLAGEATDLDGTSGNDIIDQAATFYTRTYFNSTSDGGLAITYGQTATRDQRMFGYEGDDELRGNDGVDRLIGGPGNDLLKGGSDSDMYVYASGDGLDRIIDESGTADTIYFSSELNGADLRVQRITGTNDLLLHFGDATQGIVLQNQWLSAAAAVENFMFVAEDALNAGDIASRYLASLATAGIDVIVGSWAGERLIGLDGADTLSGADGADVLDGGTGNDILNGGAHDDRLLGADGNDTLNGDSGADRLEGGGGDDTLTGGTGDDTLAGGAGNDVLNGGNDEDTYIFDPGDGHDRITDYLEPGDGDDTLVFGVGITPADLIISRDGAAMVIRFVGRPEDSIRIEGMRTNSRYSIEAFEFADGTVWTKHQFFDEYVRQQMTPGADVIDGSHVADRMEGGDGDDTLIGGAGSDTFIGGAGNDFLNGGNDQDTYIFNQGDGHDRISDYLEPGDGADTLIFGAGILPADLILSRVGADMLIGFNRNLGDSVRVQDMRTNDRYSIEAFQFADGTVWTKYQLFSEYIRQQTTPTIDDIHGTYVADWIEGGAGDDTLYGGAGDDTLHGGAGNDVIDGGSDEDTYLFAIGDGHDRISDYRQPDDGSDLLIFGPGISTGDLIVSRSGWDVLIQFVGNSDDSIRIVDMNYSSRYAIDRFHFSDGTVWTNVDLMTAASGARPPEEEISADAMGVDPGMMVWHTPYYIWDNLAAAHPV